MLRRWISKTTVEPVRILKVIVVWRLQERSKFNSPVYIGYQRSAPCSLNHFCCTSAVTVAPPRDPDLQYSVQQLMHKTSLLRFKTIVKPNFMALCGTNCDEMTMQ